MKQIRGIISTAYSKERERFAAEGGEQETIETINAIGVARFIQSFDTFSESVSQENKERLLAERPAIACISLTEQLTPDILYERIQMMKDVAHDFHFVHQLEFTQARGALKQALQECVDSLDKSNDATIRVHRITAVPVVHPLDDNGAPYQDLYETLDRKTRIITGVTEAEWQHKNTEVIWPNTFPDLNEQRISILTPFVHAHQSITGQKLNTPCMCPECEAAFRQMTYSQKQAWWDTIFRPLANRVHFSVKEVSIGSAFEKAIQNPYVRGWEYRTYPANQYAHHTVLLDNRLGTVDMEPVKTLAGMLRAFFLSKEIIERLSGDTNTIDDLLRLSNEIEDSMPLPVFIPETGAQDIVMQRSFVGESGWRQIKTTLQNAVVWNRKGTHASSVPATVIDATGTHPSVPGIVSPRITVRLLELPHWRNGAHPQSNEQPDKIPDWVTKWSSEHLNKQMAEVAPGAEQIIAFNGLHPDFFKPWKQEE